MLFSQRKGITPIKSVIQTDSLDADLRNALWSAIAVFYHAVLGRAGELMNELLINFWLYFYKQPVDTFDAGSVYQKLRSEFLQGNQEAWYRCYDILEFIAAYFPGNVFKDEFIKNCNNALARELSAYRFVGGQITQITSEAEMSSIEEALADTHSLRPVHEHLKTALEYLSDRKSPDYRNSIKESISAVESMCNLITDGKDTLGEALKKVEAKVAIHPALKKGFSNIYGYTSDAGGIRHALLDEPNLKFEDAKYMLVSCSAFINYLIAKATEAGITF
jgi:hypothetical protein